jgi:hypothetical protein
MKCNLPLLYVLIMALTSCTKNQYSAGDVTIKAEGYTERGIELRFTAPAESLYYCPGVNLEYEGDKVRYIYVRSKIDKSPSVDAKAELRDGESVVVIPFPSGHDRIELIAPSGKSLGAWSRSKPKK